MHLFMLVLSTINTHSLLLYVDSKQIIKTSSCDLKRRFLENQAAMFASLQPQPYKGQNNVTIEMAEVGTVWIYTPPITSGNHVISNILKVTLNTNRL